MNGSRTKSHHIDHDMGLLSNIDNTFTHHSPYTGNCNGTNSPDIFPHDIILRKVITGCEVISRPLARSTWEARKLIKQVFMRLTGCTDPAAVFT